MRKTIGKDLFKEILTELMFVFNKPIPEETLKMYWKHLRNFNENNFRKTALKIIRNENRFPPIAAFYRENLQAPSQAPERAKIEQKGNPKAKGLTNWEIYGDPTAKNFQEQQAAHAEGRPLPAPVFKEKEEKLEEKGQNSSPEGFSSPGNFLSSFKEEGKIEAAEENREKKSESEKEEDNQQRRKKFMAQTAMLREKNEKC